MAESHSELKGLALLVNSAHRYSIEGQYYAEISITLPLPFDFAKDGNRLLRNIQSAANLFSDQG